MCRDLIESTQKGKVNITEWLIWFLECLEKAIDASDTMGYPRLNVIRVFKNQIQVVEVQIMN